MQLQLLCQTHAHVPVEAGGFAVEGFGVGGKRRSASLRFFRRVLDCDLIETHCGDGVFGKSLPNFGITFQDLVAFNLLLWVVEDGVDGALVGATVGKRI